MHSAQGLSRYQAYGRADCVTSNNNRVKEEGNGRDSGNRELGRNANRSGNCGCVRRRTVFFRPLGADGLIANPRKRLELFWKCLVFGQGVEVSAGDGAAGRRAGVEKTVAFEQR